MSTSSSSSSLFSTSSDESENEKISNTANIEETYSNTIINQAKFEDISSPSESESKSETESETETESEPEEQRYVPPPRLQTQMSMVPPSDYASTSNATPFTLNKPKPKNKSVDFKKVECQKCKKLFSPTYIKRHLNLCKAVSN